ncbi:14734_t:CDS:2, partial [Gigaspora margarita]
HGLVIHGSPLLKERGCTPGGKYHDCSRDDACKYDDDCAGDMECNENGYCEPTYDPGPPCC